MMRLIACVSFLGLMACSDANGHAANQISNQEQVSNQGTNQISNQAANRAQAITQPVKSETLTAKWIVDTAKSTLSFSGSQSGEAFSGTFERFDSEIVFDPTDLEHANVTVTIDMNSADAGDTERTDALPGKEWFYTRKFPVAKFEAIAFKHLSGDNYEAKGSLTIKDISQNIVLPFTLKIENGQADMQAELKVNRSDYKVGTGMWASEEWVDHDVVVNVHLQASKK